MPCFLPGRVARPPWGLGPCMLGGRRPGRGPRGGPPEGSPRPLCIPPSLSGTRPLLSLPAPWSLCPGSATTRWMDAWTGAASTGSTPCRTGSLCECSRALLRGLWGFPSGVRSPLRQSGCFSDKTNKIQKKRNIHIRRFLRGEVGAVGWPRWPGCCALVPRCNLYGFRSCGVEMG